MLTKRQKRFRRKYTRIVKLNGKWSTFLSSGVQEFEVVSDTTKKRAEMYANCLACAIENIVKEEACNGDQNDR